MRSTASRHGDTPPQTEGVHETPASTNDKVDYGTHPPSSPNAKYFQSDRRAVARRSLPVMPLQKRLSTLRAPSQNTRHEHSCRPGPEFSAPLDAPPEAHQMHPEPPARRHDATVLIAFRNQAPKMRSGSPRTTPNSFAPGFQNLLMDWAHTPRLCRMPLDTPEIVYLVAPQAAICTDSTGT
jgi:hypothetical protein